MGLPGRDHASASPPPYERVSFWLTVSFAVLLLGAIIYPFFLVNFFRPRILVLDVNGNRVPYARLVFKTIR
jgi:hypothetical protein